jgi:PKD repeat protein
MNTHLARVLLGISLASFSAPIARAASNPPLSACFTVTPENGTVVTLFLVDAACSADDQTPADQLKYRWDWESDGTWDTEPSSKKTASHRYTSEGPKTIRLEVQDSQGLKGTVTHEVVVMPSRKNSS